jgi:cell division protein FtsZ
MVFITAGMGGGTGSGAAPVVAHIAKEKGILTVGVVTKPFSFEGRKRMETAESSLSNFIKEVDSIIVIPNQNLFRIADKNTTLADAFLLADNVLYSGVRSITDLMMMPGLINLDFADVRNIMQDKGKAIMGTGEAEGENRAAEAAKQALSNPLLDDCSMHGAKGVLINITGSSDITLMEIDEAASIIKEEVDDNANIIFGSSYDESLSGKIRVSIVVTGIQDDKLKKEPEPRIKEPSLIDSSYDDASFVPTLEVAPVSVVEPQKPVLSEELNEKPVIEENQDFANAFVEEEQKEDSVSSELENDFASLDTSDELPEVPQASALFNAIMNNSNSNQEKEEKAEDFDLSAFTQDTDDFFKGSTPLQDVNSADEEELFSTADNDVRSFKDTFETEEPVAPKVEDVTQSEPSKPTFIDRVIGFRNRKKAEVVELSAEEKYDDEKPVDLDLSGDDLDIPSFLRRK